jgi:hypothetical protein
MIKNPFAMQASQYNLTAVITIVMLSIAYQGYSQHKAALKIHTFRILDGLYTISYEEAFNKHISAELALQAGDYADMHPNRFEYYRAAGIGIIGAFRYYPFTKKTSAPHGFFGYTAFRFVDFNESYFNSANNARYKVGGKLLNIGLGIGYKYAYRRIGLEGFIGWGAGKLISDDDELLQRLPYFFHGAMEEQRHFPQLDVAICYMFSPFSKQ